MTAQFVIGAYHRLFHIESFCSGCPRHDVQARPIYHHQRDSIEAHLTIAFAASRSATRSGTPPAGRSRKLRPHRPPLRHHRNPGRRPHHHRRRPLPEDPAKPSKRSPKPADAWHLASRVRRAGIASDQLADDRESLNAIKWPTFSETTSNVANFSENWPGSTRTDNQLGFTGEEA